MSDVFVVPNLNVMYEEAYELDWDESTCSVETDEHDRLPVKSVFDVNDESNKPSMSFFSRYHIEYVKLPKLRQSLQNEISNKPRWAKPNEKIKVLETGISGWEVALAVERNTKNKAVTINEWFEEVGKNDFTNIDHLKDEMEEPWNNGSSGLAPNTLKSSKLKKIPGYNPKGEDEKNPINRIQFSGGGNTFSMTMSKEKMSSSSKLVCWDKMNSDYKCKENREDGRENDYKDDNKHWEYAGFNEIGFAKLGIGVEGRLNLASFDRHWTHETTLEDSDSDDTSISFVLGDADAGDEFVVDLFFDEKYGTVIFNTVAGQSRCPYELGTAKMEDPVLEVISRAPQNVFPDEDMVFELMMKNMGVANETLFSLTVTVTGIEDGLQVILDGASHTGSRSFTNIKKDTAYKKTMVLRRGPKAYKYKALDIAMESQCLDDESL